MEKESIQIETDDLQHPEIAQDNQRPSEKSEKLSQKYQRNQEDGGRHEVGLGMTQGDPLPGDPQEPVDNPHREENDRLEKGVRCRQDHRIVRLHPLAMSFLH